MTHKIKVMGTGFSLLSFFLSIPFIENREKQKEKKINSQYVWKILKPFMLSLRFILS